MHAVFLLQDIKCPETSQSVTMQILSDDRAMENVPAHNYDTFLSTAPQYYNIPPYLSLWQGQGHGQL